MAENYPQNIEQKIGFADVRRMVADYCSSSLGKEEAMTAPFLSEYQAVRRELTKVDELKGALERSEALPDFVVFDLQNWLPRLQVGDSYASPEEFFQLKKSLTAFGEIKNFFSKKEGDEDTSETFLYPELHDLFSRITLLPHLIKEIDRIIDSEGNVRDSASPELAEVRREIAGMKGSISRAIHRIHSRAVGEGITEKESQPVLRDGRFVIPVPAINKRRLQGIIHDESASGKTVFIEPAETILLNNKVKELFIEEQRIIVKILRALANEVRPEIGSILDSNRLLGQLDYIMAKAKFAISINAEMPHLSKHPEMDWYGAVNPILHFTLQRQGKRVVPLNIRLEKQQRFLIISGPNAGGKSVALKTVAINQYMIQCGLLPAMYSNSHVGIFRNILLDIGDQQSIEDDLSTYSSHLKNMKYFLARAAGSSLVLIDEIGSGTEPTVGAAIAKAIIIELQKSKCFAIITTHYHSLKMLAEEVKGIANGAMLFDRGTLSPTFQLSIGSPGSSFALEIAAKIGLPKGVLDSVKAEVGEDYTETDRFLIEIARDRKYWQTKRENIRKKSNRVEALEKEYEALISDLKSKKKEILKEARQEAENLLSTTNRTIENTIAEIKRVEAEKEKTKEIRRRLAEYKESVESVDADAELSKKHTPLPGRRKKKERTPREEKSNRISPAAVPKPAENRQPEVGDDVKLHNSSTVGTILGITGNEAEVAIGQLRTRVKLNQLTVVPKRKGQQSAQKSYTLLNGEGSDIRRRRQLEFKNEIDIRGMRVDEAIARVNSFIDEGVQYGHDRLRILHGTGTGALRTVVRDMMQRNPYVASFADEDVRMGGAGITVVTLR